MARRSGWGPSTLVLLVVPLFLAPGPSLLPAQSARAKARASRKAQAKALASLTRPLFARRRRRGKAPSEAQALRALEKLRAFQEKSEALRARTGPRGRRKRRRRLDPALLDRIMPMEERKRALSTVARALFAAERGGYARLVQEVEGLRSRYSWDFSRPLRPAWDVLPLLLVSLDQRKALQIPPQKMKPYKAADRFPGPVPPGAPRVKAAPVEIDLSTTRWQSTGLYAPPGEAVKVVFPGSVPKGRFTVVVGCHTDSIRGKPAWLRFPRITRAFPVNRGGPLLVGNVFGGLIYVSNKKASPKGGKIRVTVTGAVRAPVFFLGKTSLTEWKKTVRNYPAPFGEIAGKKMVLSLPSRVLRGLDDPARVARFWDRVVEAQDELADFHDRNYPERFVFDKQISAGYMHSGYPLMGPVSAAPRAVDVDTLMVKGNWGMFHEIGHNHQFLRYHTYANPWTFDGNIEVTVNIFSSYTYVAVLNKPENMGHQHWRTDLLPQEIQKTYTDKPYPQKSHKERCLFWVHLIEEFGWKTLHQVFSDYMKLPKSAWPRTNLAKRSLFLEIYSRRAGCNLAPLFEGWGLEVTKEAKDKVKSLPPWRPKVALPRKA